MIRVCASTSTTVSTHDGVLSPSHDVQQFSALVPRTHAGQLAMILCVFIVIVFASVERNDSIKLFRKTTTMKSASQGKLCKFESCCWKA